MEEASTQQQTNPSQRLPQTHFSTQFSIFGIDLHYNKILVRYVFCFYYFVQSNDIRLYANRYNLQSLVLKLIFMSYFNVKTLLNCPVMPHILGTKQFRCNCICQTNSFLIQTNYFPERRRCCSVDLCGGISIWNNERKFTNLHYLQTRHGICFLINKNAPLFLVVYYMFRIVF